MLEHNQYHAITLDLILPDQDGISLIGELQGSSLTRNIPVVVVLVTATQQSQDVESGIVVLDWITKPIDETRLLSALQRINGKNGAQPLILHVEGNKDICKVVLALVGNAGRVVVASTLAEARTKIASGHIDLIILDLGLADG